MGIYTELVIACELDSDPLTLEVIKLWGGKRASSKEGRMAWCEGVLGYMSASFPGVLQLVIDWDGEAHTLTLRASTKNHDGYYEEFLAWLARHTTSEGFVGYLHNEVKGNPELVFVRNGKAFLRSVQVSNDTEIVPVRDIDIRSMLDL